MRLLRTSLLNGVAVSVKVGTMLLLSKVLAVYLGPAGFAVVGQFQNLVTLANTLASGGLAVGITKYTAEHSQDALRLKGLWATSVLITAMWASVTVLVIVLGRDSLSVWALADHRLDHVLIWLASSLFFAAFNGLMLAVLNGKQLIKPYIIANIAGNILNAALAVSLVALSGLEGALVSIAIGQGVSCLTTLVLFCRRIPMSHLFRLRLADRRTAGLLSRYSLMFATSAIAVPLAQVQIRNHIGAELGWHDAGLWQALMRISDTHLMLLTMTLSVYFLPRFSELQNPEALRAEMRRGYRFILPTAFTTCCVLYVLRDVVVNTFLSADFLEVSRYLSLQLIGDFLKIGSWLYAITMLSHARTRQFIVTEIFFNVLYVVLATSLSSSNGLHGAAGAYAATYAVYWLVSARLFYKLINELADADPRVLEGRA